MNTQTIPTQTKSPIQVFHTIIIDGSEVEVTRFYEFMKNKWIKNNEMNFNFKNILWDNGSDSLSFETLSSHINLVDSLKEITTFLPQSFFTYEYALDSKSNFNENNIYWMYDGNINMKKDDLNRDFKNDR
jgi:hypothetical protein